MTKIKGQIYVPNKDNPLSEDDYDLILPQTTADQIEGFSGKATQEDAEAGTSDDKVMTPLRVWDAIKKYMTTFMASAVFTGIVKVIAPAIDSNDDSVPTTSWVLSIIQKIFREHVVKDYSIAQNGYIQGGDWVGGLILQWRKDPGLWAIPFTTFVAGGITMTRSGWQGSGEWNGDSGTVSLTGYSAQCATGNSVSNIGGSAIAIGQ